MQALRFAACLALVGCASSSESPRDLGSKGRILGAAGLGGGGASSGATGHAGATAGTPLGGAPSAGATASGDQGGVAGMPATGSAGTSGAGAGASAGAAGASPSSGSDALAQLRAYLALERSARPVLTEQPFASVPLNADDSATARALLWTDHEAFIRATRQAETDAKAIELLDKTLRYDFKVFGSEPPTGHSLFISLHGGGEADPSVNDEQWENQKGLYQPDEGIYLAPRAPTDTWNLWHEAHIDPMFTRLIENLIVFEGIDPNRVYVMGYSAGGDGVYQLGPRMADSWAAAAMMAGHPNDAQPDSLRNIGFTIHVGADDSAYDRNKIAGQWGMLLDALQAADPGGYAHEVKLHAGKGHWMDLEDAVAVPWMEDFTRNPTPERVVWLEDDVPHERFYWLAVPAEEAVKAAKIVATLTRQAVALEVTGVKHVKVRLSDALVDLDQPVTITLGSATLFSGVVPRTIGVLSTTLDERGDPALVFPGEVTVSVDAAR